MTTRKPGAPSRTEHEDSRGVSVLIERMAHPMKPVIESVRRTILAADSAITEGVKWNSPSFYCYGWFATIVTRKPKQLDIVLHCGAQIQADCAVREAIADRDDLLAWPSKDRATLSFTSDADFAAKRHAFQRVVKQWAAYQKRQAAG